MAFRSISSDASLAVVFIFCYFTEQLSIIVVVYTDTVRLRL